MKLDTFWLVLGPGGPGDPVSALSPFGPSGPCGPCDPAAPPWLRAINSRGGWLVVLFSLLSNTTLILVEFGMSAMPLLGTTPSTQSFTNCVKSTVTNWFSTAATPVVSTPIIDGAVAHATVRSFHAPPTAATSNEPFAVRLFTHSTSVAFRMLVPAVLPANPERSNFRNVFCSVGPSSGPTTLREICDDLVGTLVGLATKTVASSVRNA